MIGACISAIERPTWQPGAETCPNSNRSYKMGFLINLYMDFYVLIMRLLGQRPRYQEGPPRGPSTRGSPRWGRGGQAVRGHPRRSPSRLPMTARRQLLNRSHHSQAGDDYPEDARRTAGSSSGHTAIGRGFRTYRE